MMVCTVLMKKTQTFIENKILKYLLKDHRKKRGELYSQLTGRKKLEYHQVRFSFPSFSPALQIFPWTLPTMIIRLKQDQLGVPAGFLYILVLKFLTAAIGQVQMLHSFHCEVLYMYISGSVFMGYLNSSCRLMYLLSSTYSWLWSYKPRARK